MEIVAVEEKDILMEEFRKKLDEEKHALKKQVRHNKRNFQSIRGQIYIEQVVVVFLQLPDFVKIQQKDV
jgi:hypothetical protein